MVYQNFRKYYTIDHYSVVSILFFLGVDVGTNQIVRWGIWNGGLAAIFTLLAMAHPLTILTSFVLAPLATLLPMVSVGVFSAIIEATLRKPKVHDFQTMDEDIKSIKKSIKIVF